MPQSLSNVILHTVFSTKGRVPYLADSDLREDLHRYLGGVAKTLQCQPLIVGGVADHVHLLTTLSRTITIADLVKEVKRNSSRWLHEQCSCGDFRWQGGYGAFSVSASQLAAVQTYIDAQAAHHQRMSFQEEFRSLLHKHGVKFDERYVWD